MPEKSNPDLTSNKIFVSGPRPQNLGLKNLDPFSDEVFDVLIDFVTPHLIKVREKYPDVIVRAGMALGFDQAIAMACYINEIPFIAVIPGSWQSSKWSDQQKKRYNQLLHVSMTVENLELPSTDYKSALMTRNIHLLNGCIGGIVMNLESSGTLDTVKKCDTMGLRFLDIGEEWKRLAESKGL